MRWEKHIVEEKNFSYVSVLSIVLLVISLYLESNIIFFTSVVYLLFYFLNQLLSKMTGNSLFIESNNEKNRFFINEDGAWQIFFENRGWPIIGGKVRLTFDEAVSPLGKEKKALHYYEVSMPISIFRKGKVNFHIPFQAEKRGTSKIRKLEVYVPHLLGMGETILAYKDPINQEAIVYPVPIPVENLKQHFRFQPGASASPFSIFEDRQSPLGTRDYISSDSFNRIHWKASARKQTLQTKLYDAIEEKGWNISINLSDGYAITGKLEELLSSVTEIAYYAYKENFPYSLCINVRTAGTIPFLYMPPGNGKEHLQKVLEMLASVNSHQPAYPFEKMVPFYMKHLSVQPFYIHGGMETTILAKQHRKMSHQGIYLLTLKTSDGKGQLLPWSLQDRGE